MATPKNLGAGVEFGMRDHQSLECHTKKHGVVRLRQNSTVSLYSTTLRVLTGDGADRDGLPNLFVVRKHDLHTSHRSRET